jgi:hypothetical protein
MDVDVNADDEDEDVSSPLAIVVVPLPSFLQVLNLLGSTLTTKMMMTTTTQPPSKPFTIVTIPPNPSPLLSNTRTMHGSTTLMTTSLPSSPPHSPRQRCDLLLSQSIGGPSNSLSPPHHSPLGSMTEAKTTPLTPLPLLLSPSSPIKHTGLRCSTPPPPPNRNVSHCHLGKSQRVVDHSHVDE